MLRLAVAAHPGARMERVALLDEATLAVWVRARPVAGQANAAIERVIAGALAVRARQVRVIVGPKSRRKIVEIDLPDHDVLRQRLLAYAVRSD